MTENDRMALKLIGFLLEYPDARWVSVLAELGGVVDALQDGRREPVRQFLAYVEHTPPLALQETYTATFDLDPAADLHLTYHLMGDSEDRGRTLASLLWTYHREGYDAVPGELPDYLPMMLEFLSACPAPEDAALLWSCLGNVAALAERLARDQHPYAGLMALAAEILQIYGDRKKEV